MVGFELTTFERMSLKLTTAPIFTQLFSLSVGMIILLNMNSCYSDSRAFSP